VLLLFPRQADLRMTLLASVVASVIGAWVVTGIFSASNPWEAMNTTFDFAGMATFGFCALMLVTTALREDADRRTTSDRQLVELKLHALQSQIEPHFIYNTLANVQQLVRSAPADADRMLSSLIQYLKTTIPDVRAGGKATIKHELDRILSYLEIMQMRMGKRLQYSLDVPENMYKLHVPPLGILTLVENAVKHGIDAKPEGGSLQIIVTRPERKLVIRVLDNGAGFGSEVGGGMGLANLRERISTQYGERAMLSLNHRKPSGVEAILTIPAE
jgi:sensor histidine kinase YesM